MDALDADAIVAWLTGATAGQRWDRAAAIDELTRRAPVVAIAEALGHVHDDEVRETLCVALAHHPRPRDAVLALSTLAELLDARAAHVRDTAGSAIRQLVARAGEDRAIAAAPDLRRRLDERLAVERRKKRRFVADLLTDLEAALGALTCEAPASPQFVRAARNALEFLVHEYGYRGPTIDDGGWATRVVYRTPAIGVVAQAEWRDRYAETVLVRLDDGDLPLYLHTSQTHWLSPTEITGDEVPTTNADSRRLPESFQVWARALRKCDAILRGDVDAFDRALRATRGRAKR